MEAESRTSAPITSKKLWNKAKIILYMLKKTLAKTKLLVDLHINLKDGKLARKAFTTVLLHHHHAATTCGCTTNNIDTLFISPQKHKLQSSGASKCKSHHYHEDHMIEQVIIEMSNNGGAGIEPSPFLLQAAVSHELRVNESPLPDDECQVDKDAEAFIKKFYNQLKQQHITCVESPSPNYLWAPTEF